MKCAAFGGIGHALELIYEASTGEAPGVTDVVRWCRNCGAVVVDVDVDGRTQPGRRVAMQFPTIAERKAP